MTGPIGSAADIAVSGLGAAETQLDAAASNIANSQDAGPPPAAPFGSSAVAAPPLAGTQPGSVPGQVFQALQAVDVDQAGGGVSSFVRRTPDYAIQFQPDNPAADGQGLVAVPNTNPVQQSVELITARNSFAANVQSLQTTNAINRQILDVTT